MRVSKRGNGLAVRLPAPVVEALHLKEGDDIRIEVAEPRLFRVSRDTTRDDALAALESLGWTLPEDYRLTRDDAHERGA